MANVFIDALPFEDHELAELEAALGDRPITFVVGMLSAVVSVGDALPSQQIWLCELTRNIADVEQAQRVTGLIVRLERHVAAAFVGGDPTGICPSDEDPDHPGCALIADPSSDSADATFCAGYLWVIEAAGIDPDSDRGLRLLGRIARGEEAAWTMERDFHVVLHWLYTRWQRPPLAADATPPQAAHQASIPKPGRNDTCHCGSGKKYKKCHGAPGAASRSL